MTDFVSAALSAPDAQQSYRLLVSAVAADSANSEAWYRLGCLLHGLKKFDGAAGCFARAADLRPDDPKVLTNWGWALHLAGRTEEAEAPLAQAVEIDPGDALAWTNLAQVRGLLGHQDEAIECARLGVRYGGQPLHHMALAFQLFFGGELREGFRHYERRFAYRMPEVLSWPYLLWRGEKVGTLFVTAEQGIGDSILGMRWLPMLDGRVDRAVIHIHKELIGLAESVMRGHWISPNLHPVGTPLPQADAWVAMLSLPVALGVEDFEGWTYLPPPILYGADNELPPAGIRRIGLCWAGASDAEDARLKSIALADMLRIAELPGIEAHSLQVGSAAADVISLGAHGLVRDRAIEISDMADTARIIAGLDLVISADTAVAHLAGAMGKPTWLLLNQRGGDGRWGRHGERTNWYPSMRIWRRGLHEQWGAVIMRVCEELRR